MHRVKCTKYFDDIKDSDGRTRCIQCHTCKKFASKMVKINNKKRIINGFKINECPHCGVPWYEN